LSPRAQATARAAASSDAAGRVTALDWQRIEAELDEVGWSTAGTLLAPDECRELREAYARPQRFRKRIDMARHGFGRGQYQYFAYPLPGLVQDLRTQLYTRLAPVANRWRRAMRLDAAFPDAHADYLARCHAAGQSLPTPLILRYGSGDYNRLHQDLYGELVFPLQVAVLLSDPRSEFTGGELVLTEQRPRMQSRADVVPLAQGEAVVFAVNERPVQGTRGSFRVRMPHGLSRVRSGERYVLGLIFHDAA